MARMNTISDTDMDFLLAALKTLGLSPTVPQRQILQDFLTNRPPPATQTSAVERTSRTVVVIDDDDDDDDYANADTTKGYGTQTLSIQVPRNTPSSSAAPTPDTNKAPPSLNCEVCGTIYHLTRPQVPPPYYVVYVGRKTGVFASPAEADALVKGVSEGERKRFSTYDNAVKDYKKAMLEGRVKVKFSNAENAAIAAAAVANRTDSASA